MSKHSPAGRSARISRFVRLVCCTTVLAAVLLPSVASAISAPPFDPTNVISDDVFRASYSMSAADVQTFLESTPGVLDTTLAPRHSDGTLQPVSQLIWEVAQEFNINPKVLLVTLQKEQSLLTKTAPTQNALDWALGFGCPDGSTPETRDPRYKGLGNQIWFAASYLNSYGEGTTSPWYPGKPRRICTDCVTNPAIPVYDEAFVAQDLATYKLYMYTPHSHGPVPEIFGGNYLFWVTYWKYFSEGPFANPALRPVYRFYRPSTGTHFYTASETERANIVKNLASIYTFEGAAYSVNTANPSNNIPLYRFYNPRKGTHFYTASEDEKNQVIATLGGTYTFEGPVYSVSGPTPDGTPMYRFYNKRAGTHFYTISQAERDNVIATMSGTFTYEGECYYLAN